MANVEDLEYTKVAEVQDLADDLHDQLVVAEAGLRDIFERALEDDPLSPAVDMARETLNRLEAMQARPEAVRSLPDSPQMGMTDELRHYAQLGLVEWRELGAAELAL